MALPLIYLVGAGVALLWAKRGKEPSATEGVTPFTPASSNPLVQPGTGLTTGTGGLRLASQLQRDRFVTGQGTGPTTAQTPPSSYYRPGGAGGKVPGFR